MSNQCILCIKKGSQRRIVNGEIVTVPGEIMREDLQGKIEYQNHEFKVIKYRFNDSKIRPWLHAYWPKAYIPEYMSDNKQYFEIFEGDALCSQPGTQQINNYEGVYDVEACVGQLTKEIRSLRSNSMPWMMIIIGVVVIIGIVMAFQFFKPAPSIQQPGVTPTPTSKIIPIPTQVK